MISGGLILLFLHLPSCWPLNFGSGWAGGSSWYFVFKSSADVRTSPHPRSTRSCVSFIGVFFFFSPMCLVPTRLFQNSSSTSSVLVGKGWSQGKDLTPAHHGQEEGVGFCWDQSCAKLRQRYLTQRYPSSAGMLSFPAGHCSTIKKTQCLCMELIFLQCSLFLADSKH